MFTSILDLPNKVRELLRLRFGLFRNTSNQPLTYIRITPKFGQGGAR